MKSSRESTPLFSIITVCYNSEETIVRTIKSIEKQTFRDFEYIVIDGGSKDGTLELLQSHKNHISTLISEPDNGIYDAMNKGIDLARGELVGIINSDDWYEPDTLEIVSSSWQESDKKTIFHGLCKYFEKGKEGKILSYHHDILPKTSIAHPTCFIPRLHYLEKGKYDLQYPIASDYDLLLRYYLLGVSFQRIERVLANFSDGGISETGNTAVDVLRIRKKHGQISKKGYLYNRLRQYVRVPYL